MNRKTLRVVRIALLLGWLALGQLVSAQEKSATLPKLPKGYLEVSPNKKADIHKLCQATAATGLFSGAVLVANKGEVIYKQAFGMANREWRIPNTADTKFRLASVSKQFCSLLVMQLVQEGKVKLDDTISDYLPYYRQDNRIADHTASLAVTPIRH